MTGQPPELTPIRDLVKKDPELADRETRRRFKEQHDMGRWTKHDGHDIRALGGELAGKIVFDAGPIATGPVVYLCSNGKEVAVSDLGSRGILSLDITVREPSAGSP